MKGTGQHGKGNPPAQTGSRALRDELELVARDHRAAVVAACAEKVGDQDAEDMTQEGFIRVWESGRTFAIAERSGASRVVDAAGQPLRGGLAGEWKMRGRKECERRKREWSRQHGVDTAGLLGGGRASDLDPEGLVADAAGSAYLWSLMPPLTQRILQLRAEGRTRPEIAREIGRGLSAVHWRLAEARDRARDYLREVGAVLVGPCAWLRFHARRRIATALDDRAPWAWAVRELGGVSSALSVGIAAVAVMVVVTADGPSTVVGAGRGITTPPRTAYERTMHRPEGVANSSPSRPVSPSIATPGPPGRDGGGVMAAVGKLTGARTAANETPGDTHLTTAAASPDYARDNTIVALGFGKTCQCAVLYRTTDAGGTWSARVAPPGAEQVVLPPAYPVDRRIFLGTAAGSGIPPSVIDDFDAVPFPLPAPAGHVALSAGFDRGDHRAFVAANGALWSIDVDSRLPGIVLRYPDAANVAQVTSATEDGMAVFATVPASPLAAVPSTARSGFYACSLVPGDGCELRDGGVPDGVTALATAAPTAGGQDIVLAVWAGMLQLSHDGGHTFTAAPPVPSGGILTVVSVAEGQVWAVAATRDRQSHRVVDLGIASAAWHDVTAAHPALTDDGFILAVNGKVILDALASGVLCTANGGASWFSQCAGGG